MVTSYQLDKFLSGHTYAFIAIFARLGACLMLFPGIGETYVPARVRMAFALLFSFLMLEPLYASLPPMPVTISGLVGVLMYEIVVGLFFGTLLRTVMASLETTGSVIALQMGLSNAMVLNPALASQSPLPSAFLMMAGLALIFVTGLDHMLIRSLLATYELFPPGGVLMSGDMAQSYVQVVDKSFMMGIQMAAPFLVIGLLMYVALGIMQRLMPMVQLFLVAIPIQIWGGLALFAVTVGGILMVWLKYFDGALGAFAAH